MIPVPRNSGTNFKLEGVNVTGSRYYIKKKHFYCLAVEAGFYSDVVECLPVDPATWVRFPAGTGKIFSLYDIFMVFLTLFVKRSITSRTGRALPVHPYTVGNDF